MNPQPSTTEASSTKDPQPKGTLPPDGISGKYRNENLPQPMYLREAVYVLSYEGCLWPKHEQYDGVLGVYASLENAQRAGSRWLREKPGLHPDSFGPTETRFAEWKVEDEDGDWVKGKAESGSKFLESRVMRIKKCEVRMDSSLPEELNDGGGKKDEGGKKGGEKEEKKQKDHEDDEQDDVEEKREVGAVEGMERLAI